MKQLLQNYKTDILELAEVPVLTIEDDKTQ